MEKEKEADYEQDAVNDSQETAETETVVEEQDITYAANEQETSTVSEEQPQGEGFDAELERLQKLADENHQRYLRVQADFENFKRRTRQEKEEFAKFASAKIIEQLLPVIDNVERAVSTSAENKDFDSLARGIEMTFRQMMQIFEQEGLKPMETVGQLFNPDYHQAIMQVESDEYDEGTIVEEVQKGYLLKDKVLRPALVKVSM